MNPVKLFIIGVIILILGVTLFASFFSANSLSSDKVRLEDVRLIRQFLAAYKENQGAYPASILNKPVGWQTYLDYLPIPPAASNCSASDNQYAYESLLGGQGYRLSFCLQNNLGSLHSGKNSVGP